MGATSIVSLGRGSSVTGSDVSKGVIGTVAEGSNDCVGTVVTGLSVVIPPHPARKITNKVKMTTLDEFNAIKGPFVTRLFVVLMLEYRPKIIVDL